MSLRRSGKNPLSYLGVEASTPPQFVKNPRQPTTRDYAEFNIGSLWLDTSRSIPPNPMPPLAEDLYMLVSKASGIATWIPFSASGVVTLTGDSGGAVSPDGSDNIDVLGTAGRIVTSGDPLTNTITWDIGDSIADTYTTDAGDATPAANVLEILGGTAVSTTGAGNTVTVNIGDAVATQYTADGPSIATPSGNNLNVFGGTNTTTTGSGDTLTIASSTNVATQYTADDMNVAIPVANNLNIFGGIATSTSAAGDTITITASGPNNSYFVADITASIASATGAGTAYQIIFNRTYVNVGSDFDTGTGVYTAPSDGLYQFTSTVSIQNLSSNMTGGSMRFVVSGTGPCVGTWSFINNNPYVVRDTIAGSWRYNGSIILELDAGDTVVTEVQVDGGAGDTASVSIGSGGPPSRTWFTGSRIGATS